MFWRVFRLCSFSVCNLVLLYRMIWGPTGLVDYSDLRSEYAEIQRQDAALDAENLSLSREIRLLQTDQKYVEKMIRQRLHYLRDNEILYLFDAAPKSGASSHD